MTSSQAFRGLSLAPFRATRYSAAAGELGNQLCPPYDVITAADRARLIESSQTNAVRLILPDTAETELGEGDRYRGASRLMAGWVKSGVLSVDPVAGLYVYDMTEPDGSSTRGLLGAVELRDPEDGVILPHENTMAGPVSDRVALMRAALADLEPIYLVYDGGGVTSAIVAQVTDAVPGADAVTPDGTRHRLWSLTEPAVIAAIAADLGSRSALIADGHHRYATYRQLQAEHRGQPGPWDRGLALLVDTSVYGPHVHAIHRVVALGWQQLLDRTRAGGAVLGAQTSVGAALADLQRAAGFAVVLAYDDQHAVLVRDVAARESAAVNAEPEALDDRPAAAHALAKLDVTILHRNLIEQIWRLADTEETVGYAHDVGEALARVDGVSSTAVLLRPTPIKAVAQVAAAGGRMPRKSTLFTPKPASGLVFRRLIDQSGTVE